MKVPTAMVIDDSRAMRTILGAQLRSLGYEVEEAGNGQEALERLNAGCELPSLALVDWNMPVMNGIEFIQAVRANGQLRDLRLLVVTSEAEAGQMMSALSAGADEYLMKPFSEASLASKLEMLGLSAG